MDIWSLFIQKCLLCGARSDSSHALCGDCLHELPWLGARCRCCALPVAVDGLLCADCLRRPPPFQQLEAPWRYQFPLDSLILHFKHQQGWPVGRQLALLLAEHLQHAFNEGLARPQCLLPVPLSAARLRQRGFNQAALLEHWLAATLQLPVDEYLLQRNIDTRSQQGLNAQQRRRNLRHAFSLCAGADVRGRHLALVDDVVTTGSTASTLAGLLRKAGAARVDVYCLARTPKAGGSRLHCPPPEPAG